MSAGTSMPSDQSAIENTKTIAVHRSTLYSSTFVDGPTCQLSQTSTRKDRCVDRWTHRKTNIRTLTIPARFRLVEVGVYARVDEVEGVEPVSCGQMNIDRKTDMWLTIPTRFRLVEVGVFARVDEEVEGVEPESRVDDQLPNGFGEFVGVDLRQTDIRRDRLGRKTN